MTDCSKTVEYIREMARMCNDVVLCEICPLRGVAVEDDCLSRISKNPAQAIAVVQKWSDAHPVMDPVMTWKGKLRELLPNANLVALSDLAAQTRGIRICPSDVFGAEAPCWRSGCNWECAECWNGEYKEAEK